MEEHVENLLKSTNFEDRRLGVILARKTNFPIKKLNLLISNSCPKDFKFNVEKFDHFLQEYTNFDINRGTEVNMWSFITEYK